MLLSDVLFNFDYNMGTHGSAHCTGDTQGHIGDFGGVIALRVQLVTGKCDDVLGTYILAKTAAAATVGVDGYSVHFVNAPFF